MALTGFNGSRFAAAMPSADSSSPSCLPGKADSASSMVPAISASAVLLGREHSEPLGQVKVKNTFIEVHEDDSEDDDGIPMVAVKTCPTLQASRRSPTGLASRPPLAASLLPGLREAEAANPARDVMYVQPSPSLTLEVQKQRSSSSITQSSLTPGSSPFDTPAVKVKNTFIEVDDGADDDEDCLPMVATKSCPAPRAPQLPSPAGVNLGFGLMSVQGGSSPSSQASSVAYVQASPALAMQAQRSAPSPETLLANAVAAHEQPNLGDDSMSCRKAHSAPMVRVKNTFIECVDSDDEEGGMPMVAVKSCPLARMAMVPSASMGPAMASIGEATATEAASVMYVRPVASLIAQPQKVPQPAAKPAAQHRAPASSDVAPLEIRQPQWSMGSEAHAEGICRPCAWFWRPQGCTNGQECRHCHLCPMGEVKSRRKSKLASLKAKAREEAHEEATPTGQTSPEACPLRLSALV